MDEYTVRMEQLANQEPQPLSSMIFAQQDDLSDELRKARGKQVANVEGNTINFGDLIDSNGRDGRVHVPINDSIEYFSSPNDDDATEITGASSTNLQRSTSIPEGFALEVVGSLSPCNQKLVCCHFSTNGKYLASAGHGNQVFVWEMRDSQLMHRVVLHSDDITDVRFRRNSGVFATSSLDTTVKLWNLKKPSALYFQLAGHAEGVNSLDFHPKEKHLLCSCDNSDQILLWDSNEGKIKQTLKGGRKRVRFQPVAGKFLAAASGNVINVFNLEEEGVRYCLEGHDKEVRSICWDVSGRYLASMSEDSSRIWAIATDMSCIHVLFSDRNKFESCAFHPGYYLVLAIGCSQTIEWWNPLHDKPNTTLSVTAHDGVVADLIDCPRRGRIASAGHDGIVKVWQ